MSGGGKVVCVTGASGFIASWLVKLLLQRGYTVRASVRDPADQRRLCTCVLWRTTERLLLFKATLLEEGPLMLWLRVVMAELIEPAVKGTLNVLASCKKWSVKKVVVTSSMAAVLYNSKPLTPDVVVDETWFSSPEVCEQQKQWYVLSKTLAEEAAWKFSKENGIDIVTINPGMVIGPLLQSTLNTSSAAILNLINGSSTFPNATFGWVNVQDVAMAHVLAFELPSASGRYCLVERVVHYSEILKIIHELYPSFQLPDKCADDKPFVPVYKVSKEKFKSLGLDYIPLETSIKETIESLKEKNFISF
ncbi:unnamed protein product [Musa acuminata var. zebrina]